MSHNDEVYVEPIPPGSLDEALSDPPFVGGPFAEESHEYGTKPIIEFTRSDHALAATQILNAIYQADPPSIHGAIQACSGQDISPETVSRLIALAQVHATLARK